MSTTLPQRWDLERIFPGGSESPELKGHLDALEADLSTVEQQASALPTGDEPGMADRWHEALEAIQALTQRLEQAWSYTGCLISQDVKDEQAKVLDGRIRQLWARLDSVFTLLEARLAAIPDGAWQKLLAAERIQPLAFPLTERRELARRKMEPAREMLASDLGVDGYHGWATFYETVVGRMTISFRGEELSVGQAHNKFAEPDRALRRELFGLWEQAWEQQGELIAAALNHIGGFRLSLYRHRGWDSVLSEPLAINRMSEATLNAMWEAVWSGKAKLTAYLRRKAEVLGWGAVNWYDLSAPFGEASRKVSYDEAAAFIEEQFRRFSPQMADFAANAFRCAWIEAEDRPGKAPGGFCTSFPLHRESRIFMTYSGTADGVATLAHELGHAFHNHVVFDLPPLTQHYAMNVAETASTFAELLIGAAAIDRAQDERERLALLDGRLREAVALLMNIHARFLFETRFYEERRQGLLSVEKLNELMVAAQKEAYAASLGVYHPWFWASKLHFYDTMTPFYNFPYTFGYLFSAGIWARAQEEGPKFEQRYIDLLRDTGRMTVEELASRHLGVDLTKPDFWRSGVEMVLADVDEFLRLTEGK